MVIDLPSPVRAAPAIKASAEIPLAGGAHGRFYSFDLHGAQAAHGHGNGPAPDHVAVRFPGPSVEPGGVPLVRIHSECLTGDVFASLRCDCGPQLQESVAMFGEQGGYLLYLRQEGRGIGLVAKLRAYQLQSEQGLDTFEANRALGYRDDHRDYGIAAQMLQALQVERVRLLTNNPDKAAGLERHGIEVDAVLPTRRHENPHNHRYLHAKRKQGHRL
jgi:GTP cyclohydrolase II